MRLSLRLLLMLVVFEFGSGRETAAEEPVRFQRDILPMLAANCFACHGFDESTREAGLRLDVAEGATAALDSGERAIVPGKPEESELWRRIASTSEDDVMPPRKTGKHLTPPQQELVRRWILEGAKYEGHWAFQPPRLIKPPASPAVSHPLDRFIQAALAEKGLTPSPRANAATLIRRASLDLTGLPPTPEEIDAFEQAAAANPELAYLVLVDRLLSSPHYGERWGRWWLDQARYADSNGYSIDSPRQIWKFRDWVVEALNRDKSFDAFTVEQLAGDLLPNAGQDEKIATGFHRNTQINQEGGIDREQFRVDSVFDRVATTGTVWLGLTIGCAQCHDHKFDPIRQKEYYQLFAFLNNQEEPTMKVYDSGVDVRALTSELKEVLQSLHALIESRKGELSAWEAGLDDSHKKGLPSGVQAALRVAADKRTSEHKRVLFAAGPGAKDESFLSLHRRAEDLDRKINEVTTTMVLQELDKPRKSTVFIKGDFTRPADEVQPGTPAVLHPFQNMTGKGNRLDLANWLVSPENPLTARVIANRIWQHYFGRGLVETENDFGMQGSPPSHPELLDWLALELVRSGWSLKSFHRLIVTSHTYCQSSFDRPELKAKDPENYLLGRQRRLRLDAEIVRDVGLTASGLLSHKLGGPPVFPPIPDGVMGQGQVKRSWTTSSGEDKYRRGIYTFIYRATPPPSLNVFDAPDGYSTCTRRTRSNTPLQALTLLNDAAFVEFAAELEKVIRSEGIEIAFRRCTGRKPNADETTLLKDLDSLSAARVLLNLDETVTRE